MEDNATSGAKAIGFLGTGWIGLDRMKAMIKCGARPAAFADPCDTSAQAAKQLAPLAQRCRDLDEMLSLNLDGVAIATPSGQHADQAIQCLQAGLAVFCQKPLARNGAEVERIIQAARRADRLLGLDMSYRHLRGMQLIRHLIAEKAIGEVYAVDLIFHNAYGPDKDWFYQRKHSGGGCVIDLGVHMIDLALWTLDKPTVTRMTSRLFCGGKRLIDLSGQVEDHAIAQFELDDALTVSLACSWKLSAGTDAVISATFHGTRGGLSIRNVDGSFYDFRAVRYAGTRQEVLSQPPEDWQGRAAADWVRALLASHAFDADIEEALHVARIMDHIYLSA